MTFPDIVLLFVLGFVCSVISASVGGGGFLISSGLVFLGLPPQMAVGTSRFGGIGSVTAAIAAFSSGKKINVRLGLYLAVISSIGALIGMFLLRNVSDGAWTMLAALNMMLALVVILSSRELGVRVQNAVLSIERRFVGFMLYAVVGLWVGFFGGGGAIIANLILLVFFGQSFLESAGTRKIPALFVAVVTFVVSAMQGLVDWERGIVLLFGMTIGSYIGAKVIIALGDVWLRRFVVLFLVISLSGLLSKAVGLF